MNYSVDNPWVKEREATICSWKTDYNRGYINNMSTSLLVDFMSYSDRQIGEYAKMIKSCGFTGIQVTEICTAWRYSGSWETVHDRFKTLANAAHEIGLKFTVWCWAAEFSGHGWHDDEVVYSNAEEGKIAYDDPRVFAVFNKYYDIYADLAPYADRVIAHFYDPGNLGDTESIIKFAQLLFDKFRAKNPNVKFGIDTWGSPKSFPSDLVAAGMKDVMLMELPFLPNWREEGRRANFREGVKKLGCELGSWGWYTSDYEIDQQAIMTVNNRAVKDVFLQTIEQGDHVMTPSYWSELDSYHVLNFFSLYATGHLLADPYACPDTLLRESAYLVAGDKHGEEFLSVLELIRDARSGDTWDSYWWTEPGYILNNRDRCASESILCRAESAIETLERLIADKDEFGDVHLPITVNQMYRLILPHLMQIRQFAQFSVGYDELLQMKKNASSADELQAKVDSLPFEIPEYNCVIGLWGQPEARNAYGKVRAFCEENSLRIPERPVKYTYKRRIFDKFAVHQREQRHKQFFGSYMTYEYGLAFGDGYTQELIAELCDEGVFVRDENGSVGIANWEIYTVDFNI